MKASESHSHIWALFAVVICTAAYCYGEKTECYVDEEGDKTDPNNIYKCAKDHTCCREEGLPSCCQKKETDVAVWEQVTLWGILIGGIIVLALIMWCCRHDGDCCCNAKDGRKSCCGKAYGKKPEDHYADGYGVHSDTEEEDTDTDDDDDKKPPKKEPTKEASKQQPEKKPNPHADDKKPPPSPQKSAPPSPEKDFPSSPAKKHLPSPAKKHLPSPEKLPNPPSSDIPGDVSQLKIDDIP